jgi:hypothetical protein
MGYAAPAQAAGDCGTLQKQINTYGGNSNNFSDNLPHFCTFSQLAQQVLNIAFTLIAGVTIVFIIFGGYRYMVAGANSEQATKGKQTVLWAVVGLALVIMAATLVNIFINLVVNNKVI